MCMIHMRGICWTAEEFEVLKKYRAAGMTVNEISKLMKRSESAIRCKGSRKIPIHPWDNKTYVFSLSSPLDVAAVCIWWGEGTKPYMGKGGSGKYSKRYAVAIVNSDPVMVNLFIRFLLKHGVPKEKIRARIHVHTNDYEPVLKHWIEVTGLTVDNFTAPVIKNDKYVETTNSDYWGCLEIRYNSKNMGKSIVEFISNEVSKLL